MTFAALGLSQPLLHTLSRLHYQQPTDIQREAIPTVLQGRDLLAAAQTGTGKTAAFALPLIERLLHNGNKPAANSTRVLVLAPTRELAEQVLQSFNGYAHGLSLRCYAVYGGVSINPQMMALRRGVDVLVATPGRLLDLYQRNAVSFGQLQALVLDEADRMLDLGFAGELDSLFRILPHKRQTLLFSATFSDAIRQMARALLNKPLQIEIGQRNTTASQVRQRLIPVDKKRKSELFLHLLQQHAWAQVLVFVKTRKGVEQLVGQLLDLGVSADAIHGDKPQASRMRALERFKAGEIRVLVATDVAARGLDIDTLPVMVNFDLPIVAEDYVHRIGRTGRAGNSGEAISLVCADEVELLAAIERLIRRQLPREEEPGFIPDHRVPATSADGQVLKKPKKPKKKTATGGNKDRIHLGRWFEDDTPPPVKAVRKMPKFSRKP